jgi:hypothetical protein
MWVAGIVLGLAIWMATHNGAEALSLSANVAATFRSQA